MTLERRRPAIHAAVLLTLTAIGCGRDKLDLGPSADGAAPQGDGTTPATPETVAPSADASTPDEGAANPPPSPARVPYRARSIAVGRIHICAILDDQQVKCWGDNSMGQLGQGDNHPRGASPDEMGDALPIVDLGTGRKAKALAARSYATCALLDDDTVKCWGQPIVASGIPTGTHQGIGDDPYEMGDHLPPLDLGPSRTATKIALAENEMCALRDDDSLLCWGLAVDRAPGLVVDRPAARVVGLAGAYAMLGLFADGSIWSFWQGSDRPSLKYQLSPGEHAESLFALQHRSCAVLSSGDLKCWPTNTATDPSAVTPPTRDTDVTAVAFTEFLGICWLTTKGTVKCHDYLGPWAGPPDADGAGIVKLDRPATSIDGGGEAFTCALLDDGRVKCWGNDAPTSPWLGGSVYSDAGWPAVNLGTRPAP